MHPKEHLSINKQSINKDYAQILDMYNLKYNKVGYYYQVDETEKVQGWILHLSSVWTETPDLLNTILPLLISYKVPFKVAQNKAKTVMLCTGNLGYNQLGKVFCIYPENDEVAFILVKELLTITKEFRGCTIPTDFHLGGIVYTRYGSFSPKLFVNQSGHVERYIHDLNGQLIKDEYSIPFRFPKGITWPFGKISTSVEQVPITLFNNAYKIFATIKTDAKGRVMKAMRLQHFWVQWIIIKEATHDVCVDEEGRDVTDRLHWQYNLLNDLRGKIPLPKVYDFFTQNGDSYLAMEYVKGKQMGQVIWDIYEFSVWFDLAIAKKLLLIDYLLQLVDVINTLHEHGYVHRDIIPENFILNKDNKFVAIDLELVYSIKENIPNPPFTLGTPGFISPEQRQVKQPEINQDIYSLGALMVMFFTNLNPVKFQQDHSRLSDYLNFFICNKQVSHLIAACMRLEPSERPDLDTIKFTLEEFHKTLSVPGQDSDILSIQTVKRNPVNQLIKHLINGLVGSIMIHPDKVWHSNATQDNELLSNQQTGVTQSMGFYSGICGVMYVLTQAKCEGYDVQTTKKAYDRGWQYIHTRFLNVLPNVIPGLYHGAAGVALCMAKGIEAGLIDPAYKLSITKCLEVPSSNLNLAHGVAGQGLAVLNCLKMVEPEISENILQNCVNILLDNQEKDGSWLTVYSKNDPEIRYTGFSQGVAGICFFLLKYYDHTKDESVRLPVSKALQWLKKKSKKNKNGLYWLANDRQKIFNNWLNDGVAGVTLCFITAYKIFGDPAYKVIAENALRINPRSLVYHDFSLANGTIGLAEIYLTAYQVFQDDEWKTRADFIVNTLMNTCLYDSKDSCHWIIEGNKIPTADFMVGNSGILYLLMRYLSPGIGSFL